MKKKRKLSQLKNEDLINYNAWETVVESLDDEDISLVPVDLDKNGRISATLGEVWCLCRAIFKNGNENLASAMCRADSSDGPLLHSIWNGRENIRLILPPAPPFVLAKEGPEIFAKKFNLTVNDIFPIVFEVIPRFVTEPEVRKVKLDITGVLETRY